MSGQLTRQVRMADVLAIAKKCVMSSPMTLARHGIDEQQFAAVVTEAVLANPNIVMATDSSLAQAFRRCCRDGLIPDGDSAAIVLYKSRAKAADGREVYETQAQAIPMVSGLKRMARETLGAEIRSGVIYEGDDVEVVDGVGIETSISIRTNGIEAFKRRKGENCIGAWCYIKLPHEDTARIKLYSQDEIQRSKAASRAKMGPWVQWYDRMAEKACVKSAIWSIRDQISSTVGKEVMQRIKDDDNLEYQDHAAGVIDAYFTEEDKPVQPVSVENPTPPAPDPDPNLPPPAR